MRQEWSQYIATVGMSTVVNEAIDKLAPIASLLSPESLEAIFISDHVNEEGQSQPTSAWFFSQRYALESKNVLSARDCDLVVLDNNVTYFTLRWRDYNFDTPSERSRLSLNFDTADGQVGDMQASGQNCFYLKEIFLAHVKPNLWSPGESFGEEGENDGVPAE
jgi:hypothetical protein